MRQPGKCPSIAGIEPNCRFAQTLAFGVRSRIAQRQCLRPQYALICGQAFRRLAPGPSGACGLDPSDEGAGDRAHDLILDGEDLMLVAVEAIGPDVVA